MKKNISKRRTAMIASLTTLPTFYVHADFAYFEIPITHLHQTNPIERNPDKYTPLPFLLITYVNYTLFTRLEDDKDDYMALSKPVFAFTDFTKDVRLHKH